MLGVTRESRPMRPGEMLRRCSMAAHSTPAIEIFARSSGLRVSVLYSVLVKGRDLMVYKC